MEEGAGRRGYLWRAVLAPAAGGSGVLEEEGFVLLACPLAFA
jgi:hypothetical protein